jgi:hypothetical protein
VVRSLVRGGGAGQRSRLQQRARCPGAVQTSVADDRAFMSALGAAGIRYRSLLNICLYSCERGRPRLNTMELGGFSLARPCDLAFYAGLEARRDPW